MKIAVGISGASGVNLSLKLIDLIPSSHELFVTMTDNAKIVLEKENMKVFDDLDIGASIASGSFGVDVMIVVPCSMNTLAKIAVGIADNLTTRAASVMIKERKKLILAPREMPFSTIHLEHMTKLSSNGVIIAPPILGYYSNQQTLEEMENFLIGKWFDLMGIEHSLYKRWK
ncbi:MAG: UbiX family flavin prenyltransferase [Campylobacterales bacterium]|nr:UbiX family flavin prenyltransferase [Campylobacterales bacterium]